MNKIVLKDFMGSKYLLMQTPEANTLCNKIRRNIENKEKTELDFTGIECVTANFLNMAIGALYFDLTPQQIKEYLSIINACQDDLQMIKLVVDNAKRFYNHIA